MTTSNTGKQTIELAYPVGFIKDLAEQGLDSVCEFYRKNSIDPYTRYPFGTLIQPVFHGRAGWPRTLDEFRVWHERQPEAWEFIYGVPKLMAPGSKTHTLLKSRIGHQLAGTWPAQAARRSSTARSSRSKARP